MTLDKNFIAHRGSITIEAALVMPVMIITVLLIIFIAVLLYTQVYIQYLAGAIAERGSATWDNISKDMDTGKTGIFDLQQEGLYWRLCDSNRKRKEKRIIDYLAYACGKRDILHGDKKATLELKDYAAYKKLIITVEEAIKLPVGNLFRLFGIGGVIKIRAQSEAVINDNVEFIRNTDFIIDVEKEIEEKYPGLKELGDKTRSVMENIDNKVAEFFK